MVRTLILICFMLLLQLVYAQDQSWMYVIAKDSLVNPKFSIADDNEILKYIGGEPRLKSILSNYKVKTFKKTTKNTSKKNRNKTFFVQADSDNLLQDLLENLPQLFAKGEIISIEDRKIFEPNDYGISSTIGSNTGLQVDLGYLDFLGLPKAWYYTTGSREVILGISDGLISNDEIEFKDKIVSLGKSFFSKGHGISIASIAAGQGDNGHGVPGVCYDCNIASESYGDFRALKQIVSLAKSRAKVINCSWAGSRHYNSANHIIDSLYEKGVHIVASSGNKKWNKTKGKLLMYPASYKKVISVGTVMYQYEKPKNNIKYQKTGNPYVESIKGYVGRTAGFKNHDISTNKINIYEASVTTLNPAVDILAPSVGVFSYRKYALDNEKKYVEYSATSPSTPFVTGTIGLMYSLYPCLPHDEVESILKMTSMNIDAIEPNKPYAGNYGAGILQTGDAVEMVYQLYNEKEISYIKDQQFSRWDFKLTALSKEIVMQDQKFTENATLDLRAKNRIVLKPNTHLKPNNSGSIVLQIDPILEKKCDLVLRDPSIME